MDTAITVARMLIRLCGLVALVLGFLFWVHIATSLVAIHILIGLVLVLSLWTLSALAGRAGVSYNLIALAVLWGLVTLVLGIFQKQLLPGSAHWVIQVLHLLVSIGAIGIGELLASKIKRAQIVAA